ncbi:MAG TPA: ferric reductase-like transmembrane domain-containing protein [Candidatus Paceibacterota bacterium]|nr:ferric reductase-like transmembrane domain-containing protein [Candidatus Paceibacterota bacterium]HRZ34397.1 ferric reductase-like transmembrane domain-containing protein [Candidatus Paceibacterota bacterium]
MNIDAFISTLNESWPWYLSRASGLVAFAAFFIIMLSGVGFITGHSYRFMEPIKAWFTHKVLGITLGISLFVHIISLYFDRFVSFDFKTLLIPFLSDYGGIWLAIGIIAFYLILLIIISSLVLINKKPRTWKLIHILSYLAGVLIFFHALYLGTDLANGASRIIFIVLGFLIFITSIFRLWRARTV